MSSKRNPWLAISLALAVATVLLGFTASYYYLQFTSTEKVYRATLESLDKISYQVNLLINYGNGTVNWNNNTRVPIGWNLYNLTTTVAVVDAKYYPQFQSHFINAINRVGLNKDEAHKSWFWTLWIWDSDARSWKTAPVGADQITLSQKGLYAWYYQDTSKPISPPRT